MATSISNPPVRKGVVPPAIERFFQVSLYLLVVTAFFTLVTTGKLDSLSMMLVAVALLLRGYLVSRNRELRIPERWTTLLTLFYIVFYVADYALLSNNDFVTASVHLVLFVIVVKMFSIHRERDYVYLTVLAFLAVLSAAILTVDALFFAAFTFFVLVAIATFISMEMRRSARNAANLDLSGLRDSGLHNPAHRVGVHVSLTAAALLLVTAIMLCSVVIFFAMPRISGGYFSHLAQQSSLTTGFSDSVSLGEIGRIQQSNEVVMHVRVEEQVPGSTDLRLRGVALATFSGSRWYNESQRPQIIPNSYGRFDLQTVAAEPPEDALFARGKRLRPLRYRIDLEPVGTQVIFLLPNTRTFTGHIREITVQSGLSVTNSDRDRIGGVYSALSENSQPDASDLRSASGLPPAALANRYLQLPEIDPRVAKLASDITADAPTPFDKAAALERYLKTRFAYTLELPPAHRRDQLSYFLFERRQGHCEYFATAMAVMLRTQGIPSRIITGFRSGEFNNLTGDYIVRARDAHSWVEAFFPGIGWATFDPTPAAAAPTATAWNRFMLYMDAMREFWREWVISYDFAHQQQLGNTALVKGRHTLDEIKDWFRDRYEALLDATRRATRKASASPARLLGYLGTALLAIFAALLVPRAIRRWKRSRIAQHPERQPSSAASIWYDRLVRYLKRHGWHKHPVQTPDEFARTITDSRLRSNVERFHEHYRRARFGSSAEDAAQLPQVFEEITARK